MKVQSAPGGQIKGLIPLGMEMGSQKWDMGHEESGPAEYDPSLRGAEGVPLPTHPCKKKKYSPYPNFHNVPQSALTLHNLPTATSPAPVHRKRQAGTSMTLTQGLKTQNLKTRP